MTVFGRVTAFHRVDAFTENSSGEEELSCFTAETDSRGRIVIPSHVREQLSIDENSKVHVLVVRGGEDE